MIRKVLPLMLLLAACASAQPGAQTTPMRVTALPQPSMTPKPTFNPGVPLEIEPPSVSEPGEIIRPELTWDPSPESVLISGTFCCGYTTAEFVRNYLADFQIRGDGSYTWTVYSEDSTREVFTSRLDEARLTSILNRITETGFFSWEDRYANDLVADYADKCIAVQLRNMEKKVCEYAEGAPAAFHVLFEELSSGSGETGERFSPEHGFLRAEVLDVDFVTPNLQWDDSTLRFEGLPETGAWITGDALDALWKTLNQAPWGPVVGENGIYYLYTIQVEGLSLEVPPARDP